MKEPTGSPACDPATELFNLPDYRVVSVARTALGVREVVVEAHVVPGCPGCGVVSIRAHSVRLQRIRDIPVAGPVVVLWRKRRWLCVERACARRTFSEHTAQVPPFARSTRRLRTALVAAAQRGRAASEIAAAFGVGWWTVQRAVSAAVAVIAAPEDTRRLTRRLGIDEHRFRRVRFFRDDTGAWRRVEPWMTTFVDLDTGAVLGIVDGRDGKAVQGWLLRRPRWWRQQVRVVAIDPSAAFRSVLRPLLARAVVAVDHFHLIRLANDALTQVRRRVAHDVKGHRGRREDLVWAHRLLLLRAGDRLSPTALAKLKTVLRGDDPTDEIGAAWGVKEQLRHVLAAPTVTAAKAQLRLLHIYALLANTPETTRLVSTVAQWWREIENFLRTRATNAKTEAANVTIKNLKRTGRGYRNPHHYRARILLANAAPTAA